MAAMLILGLAVACGWWRQGGAAPQRAAPATGRRAGAAAAAAKPVATFSIVAFDPLTGDLGVAVASRFFGVGAVVPFAAAGVGAVATQSNANTTYGPHGLELLRAGGSAAEVIDTLLIDDPQRGERQLGVIDAHGNPATFTGDSCLAWAGGRIGDGYAVQGNILTGAEVVDAIATTFEATNGDLASRMVAALAAGQQAGGDSRGRQSAALLVAREGGGYGGYNDRYIDLRVDDHPTPIVELQRLLDIREAQLRGREAGEALRAAAAAADHDASVQRAVAALTEATRLDPGNGWHWMSLAAALLAAGDQDGAARAGERALQADPWVKTGILRGFGSREVAETLLENDDFRRAWERIRVRYRAP